MANRSRRLAINTLTTYVRMGVATGVLLVMTPYVLSRIGPERYALWTFAFAVLGLVGLVEMGFGQAVMRFHGLARADADAAAVRRSFTTLLAVHAVLAVVAMLIVAGIDRALPSLVNLPADQIGEARLVLWLLAVRSVGLGLPLGVYRQLLMAEHRADVVNAIQIPATLLQAALTWLALARGYGLPGLAAANLLAMLAEHAAYIAAARQVAPDVHLSPRDLDGGLARRAFTFSANSFVVNISALVLLRTDPLIVQFMLPLASVATYGLAMKIAEQGLMVVKQFVNLLSPLVAIESGLGRTDAIQRIFLRGTRFALVPAVLLAVLGVDFGGRALTLWVGPSFAAGGPVLAVLLVAMALLVPQLVASNVLTMSGRPTVTAQGALASAIVNVAASVVFVKMFGLIGVALGTLAAVITVDVGLTMTRACRLTGIPVWSFVSRAVLPAFMAGAVQIGLDRLTAGGRPADSWAGLASDAVAGLVAYAVVTGVAVLDAEDRARIRALMPGLPRFKEAFTRG